MSTSLFIDKIYAEFNKKSLHENIFFSPYCISMSLSVLFFGSKGETFQQIFSSEGLIKNPPEFNVKTDVLEVIFSSYLLLESSLDVKSDFVNLLERIGCKVHKLSYLTDDDRKKSAKIINDLVAEQTRNRIKKIVSPESLNVLTKAVISSVIYFEAKWYRKFNRLDTDLGTFHNSDGTNTQVTMMKETEFNLFSCDDELNIRCVGKHYKSSGYIMWVFLPIQGFELNNDLRVDKMLSMMNKSEEKLIKLTLPKFKIDCEKPLKETFEVLGMTDMFDIKKADFSKISDEPEIHVSDIFHEAFLEVNEDGTIAGAVTRK